jgi:hypothetical protein
VVALPTSPGPAAERVLPRRDPAARAHLADVSRHGAPLVLARERVLAVPGPLGELVPGGALQRGTVTSVVGVPGAGATSLALGLAAAATAAGEWAAAVDLPGTLGGLAARECGVELARFVVVRDVSRRHWSTVVAALLDGVTLVMADVPRGLRAGDAHRLVARARERRAALVVLASAARPWPGEAALRLQAEGGPWPGLGSGRGVLEARPPRLQATGRGVRRVVAPVASEDAPEGAHQVA